MATIYRIYILYADLRHSMALDLWSVINSQQRQWIGQQQNLAKIDWCSWDLCFRQIQLIVNDMMLGSALGLVGVINSQQILALICSFPVVFLFLRLISHFFSFHSVGCFRCHALRRPATYLCLCANLFHLSRVALVICFPPSPPKDACLVGPGSLWAYLRWKYVCFVFGLLWGT